MKELPQRKIIRLQGYDYSRNGYYFVTVCVKDKHKMLGKIVGDAHPGVPHVELSEIGQIVDQYLKSMDASYDNIKLEKYIIMPNHIHMIVVIDGEILEKIGTPGCASPTKSTLSKTVNAFKSLTSRKIGFPVWQRAYHERIIRNEEEYRKVWQYIDTNPSKWENDKYFCME